MTNNRKVIRGSGGFFGGGGGSKRQVDPDTLHSRQFATVQDLISEGEIEGFSTPSKAGITNKSSDEYINAALKDVFLNDTPVLSSNASNASPAETDFNFKDVTFKFKEGTSGQTAVTGMPITIASPLAVSSNVVTKSSGVGITKQISQSCDAVIVTLLWPELQVQNDKGDVLGTTVQYKISSKYSGQSSYTERINTTVSGRSADPYTREHRIELAGASFPVDIRVERITDDADVSGFTRDTFQFPYIQRIIDRSETYPNSAYTALRFDSKIFNSIPKRLYKIRGIKVRIPGAGANSSGTPSVVKNQADATALGLGAVSSFGFIHYPNGYIFNGTMQAATWTTCPAMILLDLLTNQRYGLGNHLAPDYNTESPSDSDLFANLDLFSFFGASKFANELVDDGSNSGTNEPRFSCNVNIQSPKEAFTAISELAGVMRCMPIWSAGSITLARDEATTSSYLFNLSNVGEEGFNYQGSSFKQRHSVVVVSYFNMDSKEIDSEVVESTTAKTKFGTSVKKVQAFACTSRNQAARLGRAILFAEEHETETVSFTTSIDSGLVVRPGAVIEVDDPVRSGARRGGRIVAATTSTITIDAKDLTLLTHTKDGVTSGPGLPNILKILVTMPDGTVETRDVSSDSNGVLTLSSTLPSVPNTNTPYLLTSTTLQTQLFRVIEVQEQDGINYSITALKYVEGKYPYIESGTSLPERNISILNAALNAPSNLSSEETTIVINGIARARLVVSWREPTKSFAADDGSTYEKPQGPSSYQVNYRIINESGNVGNFITQEVVSNDFEIMDTRKGSIEFEIYSISGNGKLSSTALVGSVPTEGKSSVPDDVLNLAIEVIDERLARLTFSQSAAVDVLYGGSVFVRHTAETGNAATFASGQNIVEAAPGNATEVIVPALPGTYLVKFQDDTGNFSSVAARVELATVDIFDAILVKLDEEHNDTPAFNNSTTSLFSNTQYSQPRGGLIISNTSTVLSGTYSQSGTTITCNISSHGLVVGQTKQFTFGFVNKQSPRSGNYVIASVIDPNSFTIITTVSNTLSGGSVTVAKGLNGTYDFVDTLDLGGTFNLSLKRLIRGAGFYPSNLWDDRVGLVNDFPDWDGTLAENAVAKVLVKTTTDNPSSGTATYTNFTEFSNGSFEGRGFKFQALLETTDSAQNVVIQEVGYRAEMPVRTEQSDELESKDPSNPSLAIPVNITFQNAFFVGTNTITGIPKPIVNISAQDMATGDFFELTNISGTGFTVEFKNAAGQTQIRKFNYLAVGYGKGV